MVEAAVVSSPDAIRGQVSADGHMMALSLLETCPVLCCYHLRQL